MQRLNYLFYIFALPTFFCSEAPARLNVSHLRVEHMENPTCVDALRPRLSWISSPTEAGTRGEKQTAYRIVVASSEQNLKKGRYDVWDSGKVPSSESNLQSYRGKALKSGTDYWWKVQVWNAKGKRSAFSKAAYWGMGLLNKADWKARWIAPQQTAESAPLLRKLFEAKDDIVQAKAFVTAGGYFRLFVNGQRVGSDELVPNISNYNKRSGWETYGIIIDNDFTNYRVLYLSYDITSLLHSGKNAIGAILGNGFYKCPSRRWVNSFGEPCLLCQIEVTYRDGSRQTICSDGSWQTKPSAIRKHDIYDGEVYDARLETPHWAEAGGSSDGWQAAKVVEGPCGQLTAQTSPADKVTETLKPLSFKRNADGSVSVDFGKEISGWIHFKNLRARAGDTLRVDFMCEQANGQETYVCNGSGNEDFAPHFTWYVFRGATIRGVAGITADQITAEAVNTDVPPTAEFHTSNTLYNKINAIWQRSQIDNMHGCAPSDCPHRERSPYTGDGQAASMTVMHNFDAAAFYQKWIRDIRDAQNPNTGYVPNSAPWQPGCGGGVAWGAAMSLMPWDYYLQYGDLKMLQESYSAMKAQVMYMRNWLTPDHTMFQQRPNLGSKEPLYWLNLGDWCPPYGIPKEELVHTFFLWLCTDHTARAAKVLGKTADYEELTAEANEVKEAFHRKFYDASQKSYGDFGANVYALRMGVPSDRRKDVVESLRHEIMETHGGHINTGFLATKYFFETLADNGLNEVANCAMSKTDFPSYGNWIRQGATTTWEQWDGQNSRNHPMFGSGLTWFYRCLAGVNTDEREPGYRHFIVRPKLEGSPDSVYYSNLTPYGTVVSDIARTDQSTTIRLTVPVGCHATVYLPTGSSISESGRPLSKAKGVKPLPATGKEQPVEVEQGSYCFEIKK